MGVYLNSGNEGMNLEKCNEAVSMKQSVFAGIKSACSLQGAICVMWQDILHGLASLTKTRKKQDFGRGFYVNI